MSATRTAKGNNRVIRNKTKILAFRLERPETYLSWFLMSRVALVVDDDQEVLELLAEMLEELGCEVIMQQDAAEALTALEKDQRIEILLTDINMPGIAGYDLAEQAKRLRPGVKPVLVSGVETDGYGYPQIGKGQTRIDDKPILGNVQGCEFRFA